jgi:hypothetical protein
MTTVNIAAATSIVGTTTYLTASGTAALVLLANTSTSATVVRINQIVAANTTSSAVNTTVSLYVGSSVTSQGSAPASGTAYPIASVISVPPNASLVVIDKTSALYLMENQLISVTSSTSTAITYTISYEIIT